ncbi:MAG: NAD-dependent epimerase/dehydratase family protein [Methylophilaceae bacterium]
MTNVLIVGCGGLGGKVAELLSSVGHAVTGVRVSDKPAIATVNCIQADVTEETSLASLEQVFPDVVIYCVAANEQTDDSYRMHYVDGLRNILNTQSENANLQHVFFVSSTRVYGQKTKDLLDEATLAIPSDFGGERLLEAEQLLKEMSCGSTTIRLSGIYGAGRRYLINLAKAPERWPQSNKWTNRIHWDDAARFIAFLCEQVIAGKTVEDCYIGTDDIPTLQHDVLRWLATKLSVTQPNIQIGNDVGGKRLSNQRLHDVGFQLVYESYQDGYSEMLKDA